MASCAKCFLHTQLAKKTVTIYEHSKQVLTVLFACNACMHVIQSIKSQSKQTETETKQNVGDYTNL